MGRAIGAAHAPLQAEVHVDKRRSERAPIVVRVDYATVDAFFSEFSRDINEGGLFIATDEPCSVESVVSLQFSIPGIDEPVRTRGRVVWVSQGEPKGMGIEFEGLDSAARARINQLVRRLRNDKPVSGDPTAL
jgi:type IV pilus assembly protein PilZ